MPVMTLDAATITARRTDKRDLPAIVRDAVAECGKEAVAAFDLLYSWIDADRWTRGPGMDTHSRLAVRCWLGHDVEEAAAREYLYRWNLALQSPVFGVPHTLGL